MDIYQSFKETALPATLEPSAVYFIAPAARPDFVEIYVTDNAGVAKRVFNEADVDALITARLSAINEIAVVADITARDAVDTTTVTYVYVEDASADASVTNGGATYLYNAGSTSWVKTSEAESLDVVLDWANLQNKPSSTPTDIDAAVAATHTHANKTELDKIGEDADGNLTYDGSLPVIAWASTGW